MKNISSTQKRITMGGNTSTTYEVSTNDAGLVITRIKRTVKKNQECVCTKKYEIPSHKFGRHTQVSMNGFGYYYVYFGGYEFPPGEGYKALKLQKDIHAQIKLFWQEEQVRKLCKNLQSKAQNQSSNQSSKPRNRETGIKQ